MSLIANFLAGGGSPGPGRCVLVMQSIQTDPLLTRRLIKIATIILAAAFLTGCASTPSPPATTGGGLVHQQNQGYSLLYKLMSDEKDVGKIFILKSADDSVKGLVKEIGAAAQSAKQRMDELAKTDKELAYDVTDLPYIEQRGRDLQAKDDEHALLFSSGKNFELTLLFTQAQAMDYATQLCKSLDETEKNPDRKTFLENLAKQCSGFHDRLMKMLAVQS